MSRDPRTRTEQTLAELRDAQREAHGELRDLLQAIKQARQLLSEIDSAIERGVDARVQQQIEQAIEGLRDATYSELDDATERMVKRWGKLTIETTIAKMQTEVEPTIMRHIDRRVTDELVPMFMNGLDTVRDELKRYIDLRLRDRT